MPRRIVITSLLVASLVVLGSLAAAPVSGFTRQSLAGLVGVPARGAHAAPGDPWLLAGNAGTTPTTSFLGTTDNQPLVIKTNSQEALRVDAAGNVGIGTTTPQTKLEVNGTGGVVVSGVNTADGAGVKGVGGNGPGVVGTSEGNSGVQGTSRGKGAGVSGYSVDGPGVLGTSPGAGAGVSGTSTGSDGVSGTSNSRAGAGVNGTNSARGPGVSGTSAEGNGVEGSGFLGVKGTSSGQAGVKGIGTGQFAVWGQGTGNTWGVLGESESSSGVVGKSDSGPGLVAQTSTGNLLEGAVSVTSGNSVSIRQRFHIDNSGTYVTGSDFAEALPARGDRAGYEPGDVLVLSRAEAGTLELARHPNDRRVAGVYSTRPGLLGADKGGETRVAADDIPLAIVGVVPTKVSAENGSIEAGDLLTTSNTAGHAMRASEPYQLGTIVGKALEPLAEGTGVIRVLVSLR